MKHPKPLNIYDRTRVQLMCDPEEARTEQHHKDECDVNQILKKFTRTSLAEFNAQHRPNYGDLSNFDYMDAQYRMAEANSMYEELPSAIRNQFDGPGDFLKFVQDESNEDKMRELGILNPLAEPEPDDARDPDAQKETPDTDKPKKVESEATKEATPKK